MYTYSNNKWKDQLTSVNKERFEYDDMGRVKVYKGRDMFFNAKGQLEEYAYKDNDVMYYDYNEKGVRTIKSTLSGDSKINYYSDGTRLVNMEGYTTNEGQERPFEIIFRYSLDKVIGFNYNGNEYFYQRNIQGDITHILDNYGQVVAKYVYDAWGNHEVYGLDLEGQLTLNNDFTFIGNINPFRYRGYIYDSETNLYYLNSRYYSPELGRFISPDSIEYLDPESINGLNLYAYCGNNPVMYVDPTGHSPKWWQWLISGLEVVVGIALCFVPGAQGWGVTLIGIGAGSIINGYINESNGGSFDAGWLGGQVGGFVSLIPGIGIPLGAFVGSATTDWFDNGWDGIDWNKALVTSFIAWGASLFPTMIGEFASKYKIYDKAIYFVNAYNTILTSIANSIVNVFWRGKNIEK